MFTDYMVWDGIEIVNADRTIAYARSAGMHNVLPSEGECAGFSAAIGISGWGGQPQEGAPAPWYDATDPASGRFFGLLPMSVIGDDSSPHAVTVTERVGDGAVVGGVRHAGREIMVRGLLVALDDEGARYGQSWLETVLHNGDVCSTPDPTCNGMALQMLRGCPVDANPGCADLPSIPTERETLWRSAFDVSLTEGPIVLRKMTLRVGVVWEVEFTLTAGNPYWYGPAVDVQANGSVGTYTQYHAWAVSLPQADTYGGLVQWAESFTPDKSYRDTVEAMWGWLLGGWAAGAAPPDPPDATIPSCFLDPDCGSLPAMPAYPQGVLCGGEYTGTYKSLAFRLQRTDVPLHVASVPVLTLRSTGPAYKDLRVTLTRDGASSYDFRYSVASLPANAEMRLDGTVGTALMTCGGQTRRASHLVRSRSAFPGERFPLVRCAQAYTVLVEVPSAYDPAGLSVEMALATRDT